LFCGKCDPSVGAMVLDSPFSSLKTLSEELVDRAPIKIPKLMVSLGLKMIRKTIQTKAKFDINTLEPIQVVDKCFVPALFAHAEHDDFVQRHHTQKLYDKYGGDKNLIEFEGDHNSERPDFFYDSVSIFFHNTLLGAQDSPIES